VVIFTSNIGADEVPDTLDRSNYDAVSEYFTGRVERFFGEKIDRPELFNRLKKHVVVFGFIPETAARSVVAAKLAGVTTTTTARLAAGGSRARLAFDPGVDGATVDRLLDLANYRKYGLRDVNNVFATAVGNGVARMLDDPPSSGMWRFRWDDEERRFRPTRSDG
jgi:ATP-dependent Clp protease ATP-binding subunit ClpA